jgi:hypothetical protein
MDEATKKEIAVFRFGVIADIVGRKLERGEYAGNFKQNSMNLLAPGASSNDQEHSREDCRIGGSDQHTGNLSWLLPSCNIALPIPYRHAAFLTAMNNLYQKE